MLISPFNSIIVKTNQITITEVERKKKTIQRGSINQILQSFMSQRKFDKAKLRTREMSNLLEMYITFKLRNPRPKSHHLIHSQNSYNSNKIFLFRLRTNKNSCHIIKKLFRKVHVEKAKKNFLFSTFLR